MNADVRTMLVIALAAFIPPLVLLWFLGIGGYHVFSPLDGGDYLAIGLVGAALLSMVYVVIYLRAISQVDEDLSEIDTLARATLPHWVYVSVWSVAAMMLVLLTVLGAFLVLLAAGKSKIFGSALVVAVTAYFCYLLFAMFSNRGRKKNQSPK